jgi:hypothetical protein
MKLLILQFYPASSNFFRLRSKYCLQHCLLKRPASLASTIGDQPQIRLLRPQNTRLERCRNPKNLLVIRTLRSVTDKTSCSLLLLRSVTKEISCSQSLVMIYLVTFSTINCHRKYLCFKSLCSVSNCQHFVPTLFYVLRCVGIFPSLHYSNTLVSVHSTWLIICN